MSPSMNDPPIDPALAAIEAQLLRTAPQLSITQQNELVYHAAYAAGKQLQQRKLAGWRSVAALLAVGVCGLALQAFVFSANSGGATAQISPQLENSVPVELPAESAEFPLIRRTQDLEIAATQLPSPEMPALQDSIARFSALSLEERKKAVSQLSRSWLQDSE